MRLVEYLFYITLVPANVVNFVDIRKFFHTKNAVIDRNSGFST